MKLLADESFPAPVIAALRQRGDDVRSVAETMAGASDRRVLAAAVEEERLLLTLDRDYGDLIFHHREAAPGGVILFRLNGARPSSDNQRMIDVLKQPAEMWTGRFTTVTDTLVRSRPFPKKGDRLGSV